MARESVRLLFDLQVLKLILTNLVTLFLSLISFASFRCCCPLSHLVIINATIPRARFHLSRLRMQFANATKRIAPYL